MVRPGGWKNSRTWKREGRDMSAGIILGFLCPALRSFSAPKFPWKGWTFASEFLLLLPPIEKLGCSESPSPSTWKKLAPADILHFLPQLGFFYSFVKEKKKLCGRRENVNGRQVHENIGKWNRNTQGKTIPCKIIVGFPCISIFIFVFSLTLGFLWFIFYKNSFSFQTGIIYI